MLLSPQHGPAGEKRIGRLLHSPKWEARLIEEWLLEEAERHLQALEGRGELPLCIWDESRVEKPESQKSEGLCTVRSLKAARLRRSRPGCYNPAGAPILIPGFHWLSVVVAVGDRATVAGGDGLVDQQGPASLQRSSRGRALVAQAGLAVRTAGATRL